MIRSRLAGLGLVALLPAMALGQGRVVQLRGTVQDSLGAPLAGAEVVVGRRSAVTTAQGLFVVDSLTPGRHSLTVRKIGYNPIREVLEIPPGGLGPRIYRMREATTILPTVVVEGSRPGIYGTVVLVGDRPAIGARIQVLGPGGGEVLADSGGRFAFATLEQGAYLVRVTLPGFSERRITVALARNQGRELAISLLPSRVVASRLDVGALEDLGKRLTYGMRMDRVMREDLALRGPINVCDLPQLRSTVGGPNNMITLILNGTTIYRNMPVRTLCSWRVDEVELVEFGSGLCTDVTRTLATLLGQMCSGFGRRIGPPPRSPSGRGGAPSRVPVGPFVVLWERR
jgi:hypothetical protein